MTRGAATILLVLAGCTRPDTPAAAPDSVEARAERGPVTVTVSARPREAEPGQRVRLVVDVVADRDVEIEMPQVGRTLGPFKVRAARTPPDVPDGGRRRWRHDYELDTFSTGELEIPAVSVRFTDSRDAGAPVEGELAAGPLAVTVRSVLAADEDAPRDIKGSLPVPVDRPTPAAVWIAAAAGAVAAAAAALLVVRRRRTGAAGERVIPPHEWALAALDRIEADDLVGRGELTELYFRLSDVVRGYLERRFRIMAPERTTDEFLREARASRALREEHKTLLRDFLRAADMVKFARHRPSDDDCRDALGAARRFVEETVPAEPAEAAA